MPDTTTLVTTKTSTGTKVVVGTLIGFMLGLAAYGFGFLPMLQQKTVKAPVYQPTCMDACYNNDKICRTQNKPAICDQNLIVCSQSCQPTPPASGGYGVTTTGSVTSTPGGYGATTTGSVTSTPGAPTPGGYGVTTTGSVTSTPGALPSGGRGATSSGMSATSTSSTIR